MSRFGNRENLEFQRLKRGKIEGFRLGTLKTLICETRKARQGGLEPRTSRVGSPQGTENKVLTVQVPLANVNVEVWTQGLCPRVWGIKVSAYAEKLGPSTRKLTLTCRVTKR